MTRSALVAAVRHLSGEKRRVLVLDKLKLASNTNIHEFQTRWLATKSEERKAKREAAVAAKRAKKKAAKEKEEAIKVYQDDLSKKVIKRQEAELEDNQEQVETQEEMLENKRLRDERRQELLLEAGAMSRSLFRTCLRCVKIMREGNEHDEEEFQERERNQFQSMKDAVASGTFSMAPPVDRENELTSRANYYHGHTREHFDGDSDCLKADPWREENVDTFLNVLRSGEYKRTWVMKDYKFDDPYVDVFDNERVDKWEHRVRELLRETYDANGWILPSEVHSTNREKTKWEDDDDDQPLV